MSRRLIDATYCVKELQHIRGADKSATWKMACDFLINMIDAMRTVDAVELPLKIGEKCYCINYKNEIVEDFIADYDIWSIKNGAKMRMELLNNRSYVVAEFGKTVFRTREEAEKARESKWKDD